MPMLHVSYNQGEEEITASFANLLYFQTLGERNG